MRLHPAGLLVVGAVALSGCAAHIALPAAPPRHAPYATRVRAYNTYRPVAVQYTTTISYGRYGTGMSTAATGLLLANGIYVYHPEDLLPLAGTTSFMANQARESARAQRIATSLLWSGLGASLLGVGLLMGGVLSIFNGSGSAGVAVPLLAVGGAFALTGPIPMLIGAGFGVASARNRESAYHMYESSLRENLGLCGDGTQFGDCAPSALPRGPMLEQPPPPPAPAPPPPQPQAVPAPAPQPQPQPGAGTNTVPPIEITP